MKNVVFSDVTPRGSLRADVPEELSASFIRETIIGKQRTTLWLVTALFLDRRLFSP
jgi:hypothetical protein